MASEPNSLLLEDISGPFDKTSQRYNIAKLIEDFLDRERSSAYYRFNLEARIDHECARLQEERHIRSQLEQRLAELQWSQLQLESTQSRLSEDNGFLQQEISLETKKSQDLESRLSASSSFHETLQKVNQDRKYFMDKFSDTSQLQIQIQRQQELIMELRNINQSHETTISTMQNTLHNIIFGSQSDSDSSATMIESSQDTLSSQLPLDRDNVAPVMDEIKQERTWYEE